MRELLEAAGFAGVRTKRLRRQRPSRWGAARSKPQAQNEKRTEKHEGRRLPLEAVGLSLLTKSGLLDVLRERPSGPRTARLGGPCSSSAEFSTEGLLRAPLEFVDEGFRAEVKGARRGSKFAPAVAE